jgi:hypothetical protein
VKAQKSGCERPQVQGDISSLYGDPVLAKWRPVFESQVRQLLKNDIVPTLKKDKDRDLIARMLKNNGIIFPLRRPGLFDYGSSGETIEIPILSVKFLYDLTASYIWIQNHGYNIITTSWYIGMLKYRSMNEFPAGSYPAPFEALGVPFSELDPVKFADSVDNVGFEHAFRSALLFIVAHEVAHVLGSYSSNSVADEAAADGIAVGILTTNQVTVLGPFFAFFFAAFWTPNGADFSNDQEYQKWIDNCATHPINGQRITLVGQELNEAIPAYFPGAPKSDEGVKKTRAFASALIRVGAELDDKARIRTWRQLAVQMFPADIIASDLFRLSEDWWGVGFEEFPRVASLGKNEYAAGEEPSSPSYMVIMPTGLVNSRMWTPKELDPLAFRFLKQKGLVEISGFLRKGDTQEEVLKVLRDRYGKPTRSMQALNMTIYLWIFGKSALELSPFRFKLFPSSDVK